MLGIYDEKLGWWQKKRVKLVDFSFFPRKLFPRKNHAKITTNLRRNTFFSEKPRQLTTILRGKALLGILQGHYEETLFPRNFIVKSS